MYKWEDITKWKIIQNQNLTYLNLHTHHTFNNVFEHVKNRMEDITRNLFDINLREVEIPQADPSWTRSNYTPKQLLDSSFLPRAVVMYNIDVNQESIVSIPSMERVNRANIGMTYECCTIKQPRLYMPDGQWFDYMKDIDFSLVGTPKYSTVSIFWNVLVNEQPLAIDLVKQFKFHFPINETFPIFNGFVQIKPPYGPKIDKPFLVEAFVPRKLVNDMANMFQIEDNMLLAQILRMHSHNRIEYKVNSGASDETYADIAVSYPTPIYLTPASIDMIEQTDDNLKYYGVKIEFIVNYIDISTFRLSHSMKAINKYNVFRQVENTTPKLEGNDIIGYVPVLEANFTQNINGTTIWDYFKVEYIEEDIDVEMDDDNKPTEFMTINMKGLSTELTINQYINHIIKSKCNLDRSSYFNIEVKRTKRKENEPWMCGTEAGFELDYDKFTIKDYQSRVGDSVYVALYINKDHYNKWLERHGFTNSRNLSSVIGG